MDKEQLIGAIRNATNGTFRVSGLTTCLGWSQEYDKFGRPLRADPNITTGRIKIDGKYYLLKTRDWHSEIYDQDTKELLAEVDFMPDYVREYWEKKIKDG